MTLAYRDFLTYSLAYHQLVVERLLQQLITASEVVRYSSSTLLPTALVCALGRRVDGKMLLPHINRKKMLPKFSDLYHLAVHMPLHYDSVRQAVFFIMKEVKKTQGLHQCKNT